MEETASIQPVENPLSSKFSWRIENFSKLNTEKHYSDIFIIGGYKWRMLIFPKGNNLNDLSMYLDVADSENLPYGWSRNAQFSLAVINQIHNKNSMRKVTKQQFNARESAWGFTSFMPLSELYDPGRGYLVNDTCIFEAEVLDYFIIDSKCESSYIRDQEEEQKNKEKAEAKLYVIIKVVRDEDLVNQIGRDIYFDLVDHDKVHHFRIEKQKPFKLFKEEVAQVFGIPVEFQRFWLWAKRQNHTYRPDRPVTRKEEAKSVGQLRNVSQKAHNAELKLFLEVEFGPDLRPIHPPANIKKDILLFFKLYDPVKEELRYVGRLFVYCYGKPAEILEKLNKMAGFAPNEEIELYEEIKFVPTVMCDSIDKQLSFQNSQLGNGDIICFQKSYPIESCHSCRYPDVPSFLEYLDNHQKNDVYGAWEQYLGLEHSDSAPKRAHAANWQSTLTDTIVADSLERVEVPTDLVSLVADFDRMRSSVSGSTLEPIRFQRPAANLNAKVDDVAAARFMADGLRCSLTKFPPNKVVDMVSLSQKIFESLSILSVDYNSLVDEVEDFINACQVASSADQSSQLQAFQQRLSQLLQTSQEALPPLTKSLESFKEETSKADEQIAKFKAKIAYLEKELSKTHHKIQISMKTRESCLNAVSAASSSLETIQTEQRVLSSMVCAVSEEERRLAQAREIALQTVRNYQDCMKGKFP